METKKFNTDSLFLRLIPGNPTFELPEGYPFDSFLDLVVGYRWLKSGEDGTMFSVPVKSDELEEAEIKREKLFELAADNTRHLFKSKLYRIEDVVNQMITGNKAEDLYDGEGELPNDGIYVWTNEYGMFGAAAIVNDGALKLLSERFGGDYYILPSSIHEVILIPNLREFEGEKLREIVNEVNCTSVEVSDFLSDNVYMYNADLGEITVIA